MEGEGRGANLIFFNLATLESQKIQKNLKIIQKKFQRPSRTFQLAKTQIKLHIFQKYIEKIYRNFFINFLGKIKCERFKKGAKQNF